MFLFFYYMFRRRRAGRDSFPFEFFKMVATVCARSRECYRDGTTTALGKKNTHGNAILILRVDVVAAADYAFTGWRGARGHGLAAIVNAFECDMKKKNGNFKTGVAFCVV